MSSYLEINVLLRMIRQTYVENITLIYHHRRPLMGYDTAPTSFVFNRHATSLSPWVLPWEDWLPYVIIRRDAFAAGCSGTITPQHDQHDISISS